MKKSLITTMLMLLNIPVGIVCIYFGFIMFESVVIKFTNPTNEPISNVNIDGCSHNQIRNLEPGESNSERIRITYDCRVFVHYTKKNERIHDTVSAISKDQRGLKLHYIIGEGLQ